MPKLYTKKGDDGFTGTQKSERISKCDSLICLIGTLDEFSAVLGVCRTHIEDRDMNKDIENLQKMLIAILGELSGGKIFVNDEVVKSIEELTDKYTKEFSGFTVFGENKPSAYLNLARCVVRRAERIGAECMTENKIRKSAYCVLNRLSDLMYAMSRYAE